MALPISMLRKLHMPLTRKLGLIVLFALAVIDVIFDILRTIDTKHGAALTVWDLLEPTTAVIISSLPTYRALFKMSRKRSTDAYKTLAPTGKTATLARSRQEFEMDGTLRKRDGADEEYAKVVAYSVTPLSSVKGRGPAPVVVTDVV